MGEGIGWFLQRDRYFGYRDLYYGYGYTNSFDSNSYPLNPYGYAKGRQLPTYTK